MAWSKWWTWKTAAAIDEGKRPGVHGKDTTPSDVDTK